MEYRSWEDIERLRRLTTNSTAQLVQKHRTKEDKQKLGDLALELLKLQTLHETDTQEYTEIERKISEIKSHEFRDFKSRIRGGNEDCAHYWGYKGGNVRSDPMTTRYECTECHARVELED
jgi:hypothetical protein